MTGANDDLDSTQNPADSLPGDWKSANLVVDTVSKGLSPLLLLATLISVVLAYRSSVRQSEDHQMTRDAYERRNSLLEVTVATKLGHRVDDSQLVYIDVFSENKGNSTVQLLSHDDLAEFNKAREEENKTRKKEDQLSPVKYDGEGICVRVWKHPVKLNEVVNGRGKLVVNHTNILESYASWPNGITLGPGAKSHDASAVLLEAGGLYEIAVRYYGMVHGRPFTQLDTSFVYVPRDDEIEAQRPASK